MCVCVCVCVCVFITFDLLDSSYCKTSVTYMRCSDQRSFVLSMTRGFCQVPSSPFPNLSYLTSKDETPARQKTGEKNDIIYWIREKTRKISKISLWTYPFQMSFLLGGEGSWEGQGLILEEKKWIKKCMGTPPSSVTESHTSCKNVLRNPSSFQL